MAVTLHAKEPRPHRINLSAPVQVDDELMLVTGQFNGAEGDYIVAFQQLARRATPHPSQVIFVFNGGPGLPLDSKYLAELSTTIQRALADDEEVLLVGIEQRTTGGSTCSIQHWSDLNYMNNDTVLSDPNSAHNRAIEDIVRDATACLNAARSIRVVADYAFLIKHYRHLYPHANVTLHAVSYGTRLVHPLLLDTSLLVDNIIMSGVMRPALHTLEDQRKKYQATSHALFDSCRRHVNCSRAIGDPTTFWTRFHQFDDPTPPNECIAALRSHLLPGITVRTFIRQLFSKVIQWNNLKVLDAMSLTVETLWNCNGAFSHHDKIKVLAELFPSQRDSHILPLLLNFLTLNEVNEVIYDQFLLDGGLAMEEYYNGMDAADMLVQDLSLATIANHAGLPRYHDRDMFRFGDGFQGRVLILQGMLDVQTPYTESLFVYGGFNSTSKKTLVLFPDRGHDVKNPPYCAQEIFGDFFASGVMSEATIACIGNGTATAGHRDAQSIFE